MKRGLLIIILVALISMFHACSIDVAGGATSETTNGMTVSGFVVSEDGGAVDSADVFIRHSNFLKDTSAYFGEGQEPDAVTDSLGCFSIDSIEPGEYYVEINYRGKTARVAECNKESDIKPFVFKDMIQLLPVAGFYGIVDRANIPSSVNIYVQIYGLDKVQKVENAGTFYFSGIPAGNLTLRFVSSDSQYGVIEYDTIAVTPAENWDMGTYIMPFEAWKDTLAVRAILDSNGLFDLSYESVTEIKNGRVVDLNLNRLNISIMPKEIGVLRLKRLHCADNSLESLPNEIGEVRTLDKLIVKNNNIGKLPGSIEHLTHMKHMDLSKNKLSSLPKNISKLTRLDFLSVDHNGLISVDPAIKIWIETYSTNPDWELTQDTLAIAEE